MVKVTDLDYYMSSYLVDNLNFLIKRQKVNWDNLILIDGDEGSGKSTFSWGIAYYLAWKTGKKFTVDNVFFDLDDMLHFAKDKERQVIIWDEAALGGLSSGWNSDQQKKLLQIMMISRKKGHFWIFIIPQFFRLNFYLAVDRSFLLLHVSSSDRISRGRFLFFNKTKKETLYNIYRSSRKKLYGTNFNFVDKFTKDYINLIDSEAYEKKKDDVILKTVNETKKNNPKDKKIQFLKNLIGYLMTSHNIGGTYLAKLTGQDRKTFGEWKIHTENTPNCWRAYPEKDNAKNMVKDNENKINTQ